MSTVTLPVTTLERVEKKLQSVLEEVRALKRTRVEKSSKPARFWTKQEWEKAEREADKDIKNGRVYRLNRVEDLDKPLTELAR